MKYSADYKQIARDSLFGNWRTAILAGFVASLFGATLTRTVGINSSSSSSNNETITDTLPDVISEESLKVFLGVVLVVAIVLAVWGLISFFIGGAIKLGYAKFNLNLVDKRPAVVSDLFSEFNRFGAGLGMNLLMGIYVFLWTLLFIIPGIVKGYSYAMTPYILAENPEMSADQAITESRKIMNGNKWRLFCLEFSFIGWRLLMIAPLLVFMPLLFLGMGGFVLWIILFFICAIVGSLFLTPYIEAAQAAFYRDITYVPTYVPREDVNY